MTRDEIRDRIVHILTSKDHMSLQLDASGMTEDTSLLSDLGMDSIQILELTISLEETFGLVIGDRLNLSLFDRFGDLVDFVEQSVAISSSR